MLVGQKLIHHVAPQCRQTPISPDQINIVQDIFQHLKNSDQIQIPTHIITEVNNADTYQGRLMVAEVLQITDQIKQMIVENATLHSIQEHVLKNGFMRILDTAAIAMCQGKTSREELVRLM